MAAGDTDVIINIGGYGGHDTRLWGRFIIPVWQPPTPASTPFYRKG